jgi:hypothetical protein
VGESIHTSTITVRCSCGLYLRACDLTVERVGVIATSFLETHAYHEPYPHPSTGKKE